MNKRKLRGVKRSFNRWLRRHGFILDVDYMLGQFGLARKSRLDEAKAEIRLQWEEIAQLKKACSLIDEDALYE